jgi:hypothetical protein
MGRTGRKREGRVVFLLTEGKEERDHARSQESYEEIQQKIISGKHFQFDLDKSPRILPPQFQPDCVKKEIIPPKETSDDLELKIDRRKKALPKRQRDWSLPEGAETGFVSASTLGPRKRPKTEKSPSPRRVDILDTKSNGSIPAGSLRNGLVHTRKAMNDPVRSSRMYTENEFEDLNLTAPQLLSNKKTGSPMTGLSKRAVNVPRRDGISAKAPVTLDSSPKLFKRWDEDFVSDEELPELTADMFLKSNKKKENVVVVDNDEEYGLPSEFEVTPRKRIRIAQLSDDDE